MSAIVSHELHNQTICNDLKNVLEFQNQNNSTKGSHFPQYSTFEDRMKSFDEWPKSMKMKPKALSDAGFFYLGQEDRAVCFHCGGGLNEWKEFDDPWVEHAYWFPKCKFILNEKGQEFVSKAVAKKAEIISVQNSETITNAIDEIMNLITSKKKKQLKLKKEVIPIAHSEPKKQEAQIKSDSVENNSQNIQSSVSILCKICFSEEKNILFVPCKHLAVCMRCSENLSTCPICRKTITDTIRIYNS